MRCDHCHDKTADDRRRFCEYCGRQLSRPEENPIETATTALDDLIEASSPSFVEEPVVAPVETASHASKSARCESCGGPAGDADLCDACQRAFHAVIESKRPETSVDTEEDDTEEDELEEDEFADFPEPPAQASPAPEPTNPDVQLADGPGASDRGRGSEPLGPFAQFCASTDQRVDRTGCR